MPKAEIGWTRPDETGHKLDIYARLFGGDWRFFRRSKKRCEQWEPVPEPPLEDWLKLLDAVRRRVQRRRSPPDEIDRVRQRIRERFPEEEV